MSFVMWLIFIEWIFKDKLYGYGVVKNIVCIFYFDGNM